MAWMLMGAASPSALVKRPGFFLDVVHSIERLRWWAIAPAWSTIRLGSIGRHKTGISGQPEGRRLTWFMVKNIAG
jgi:hypothetical protein